jgi:SWI/SNF-related matrix-associated actin-dependent regulator of chromatin subfamily A3
MPVIAPFVPSRLISIHSIGYVRFDGQMSARKRQEAIARFSVPVKESGNSRSGSQAARATRTRGKGKAKKVDDNNDFDFDDINGDADFTIQDDEEDDDKFSGEVNPRVMLISLKAVSCHLFIRASVFLTNFKGALGLNLTGKRRQFIALYVPLTSDLSGK